MKTILITKKRFISNFPSGATSIATISHHSAPKLTVTVLKSPWHFMLSFCHLSQSQMLLSSTIRDQRITSVLKCRRRQNDTLWYTKPQNLTLQSLCSFLWRSPTMHSFQAMPDWEILSSSICLRASDCQLVKSKGQALLVIIHSFHLFLFLKLIEALYYQVPRWNTPYFHSLFPTCCQLK